MSWGNRSRRAGLTPPPRYRASVVASALGGLYKGTVGWPIPWPVSLFHCHEAQGPLWHSGKRVHPDPLMLSQDVAYPPVQPRDIGRKIRGSAGPLCECSGPLWGTPARPRPRAELVSDSTRTRQMLELPGAGAIASSIRGHPPGCTSKTAWTAPEHHTGGSEGQLCSGARRGGRIQHSRRSCVLFTRIMKFHASLSHHTTPHYSELLKCQTLR